MRRRRWGGGDPVKAMRCMHAYGVSAGQDGCTAAWLAALVMTVRCACGGLTLPAAGRTTPEDVAAAKAAGIVAFKLYPAGAVRCPRWPGGVEKA